MNIIYLIQCLFIYICLHKNVNAVRIEAQDFVYSAQYIKKHDKSEQQGMFNNIQIQKQNGNLVFISAGDSGIKVVDPNQNYTIIYTFRSTEYIEGFAITKDANYILLPYQQKLTIFDFSNRKQFIQIAQDTEAIYCTKMLLNDSEDIVFILQSTGHIRTINISDKKTPFYAGALNLDDIYIYDGFLSKDFKWLLVCQGVKGLEIYSITKKIDGSVDFVLAGYYDGKQSGSQAVDVTNDNKYIINIDNKLGVSIGDFSVLTSKFSNTKLDLTYSLLNYWPTKISLPSAYSLCISQDNKFVYLGVLSQGIYFIDIQNIKYPSLYGTIQLPYHGMSIKLSLDEKLLYFADAESFYVFPKIKPNLNEQYINVFNGHLSTSFDESATMYYFRCYLDDERRIYFGAFDNDGLWILDVENPINMKAQTKSFFPTIQKGKIDVLILLKENRYVVVPTNDPINNFVISVYDTKFNLKPKEKYSLKFIQGVKYQTNDQIVDFATNNKETLLVGALGKGLIFFDIETAGDFKFLKRWKFDIEMKGSCSGVMITQDDKNKYVIGASRGFGYFVIDIQDLENIKLVQYIHSLGAENLFYSSIQIGYCFFFDGLNGVAIMDISNLPKISEISRVQIPGWSNDIQFLNEEKQMIISSIEKGMITLVDIQDTRNPFIVSVYSYQTQNGMSSCSFQDNSYLFINNNLGVRALPTKNEVVTHVEIQQELGFSDDHKSFIYKNLPMDTILQVGQTIKIYINHLYQPYDITVLGLQFYYKQVLIDLPSWITYDPIEISIRVNIVKEAIDPTDSEKSLLNIIVIKTINPLFENGFKFTDNNCPTDDDQSRKIFEYIVKKGVINDQNFISPDLEFNDGQDIRVDGFVYTDDDQMKCLSNLIKSTLLNSIQYSPIYLFMKSSLSLNLQSNNSQPYIQTITKEVQISIEIAKFSGQFIFKNQISVTISINEEKNEIRIHGSVQNVNNFLKEQIILFAIVPNVFSTIQAKLIIEDGQNYPIEKALFVSEIPFIIEKKNIQINPELILQNQLSDTYSNSEIEILSDFLFTFDINTFKSPDVDSVRYSAFIKKDGEYITLDKDNWLQFNPQGQKFYGNPPQNQFKSIIKVKILGDDGYTKIFDTFQIKVAKLPALFVFQWVSSVLGPIIGAFGLYKYRNYFYNGLYKHRNRYSKVNCRVNEKFVLKIPLISNEQNQAKLMIESLIMEINKSKKKVDLQKITKKIKLKKYKPDSEDIEKKQQNKFENKPEVINKYEVNTPIKETESNFIDLNGVNSFETQNIDNKKQIKNTDNYDISQKFQDRINKTLPYVPITEVERKYISEDGKINMTAITNDLVNLNINFKFMGKQMKASEKKDELTNNKSAIYKCIKSLFARYFISLNEKTFLVSEYIRQYGQRNCFLFTKNDWYKQFVTIISDDDLDIYGQATVFPKLKLISENINTALHHLNLLTSKEKDLFSLSEQNINPYLIKTVLMADALGIHSEAPSVIFPSKGESIYLKSHELRSVQSFKYSPGGKCFSLKQMFNVEYDPYGPKENMQFPNWLKLTMQSGVILLQGTPQSQDIEEILIRFYGHQGFIYRSFTLRVLDVNGRLSQLFLNKKKKNTLISLANELKQRRNVGEVEKQNEINTNQKLNSQIQLGFQLSKNKVDFSPESKIFLNDDGASRAQL